MDNTIPKIKKSILTALSFGVKQTLPNGVILNKTLNNEIIYEFKGDIKKVSESEVKDILDDMKFWKMKNGRYIEIHMMATSHIINTIKHQQKKLDFLEQNGGHIDGYGDFLESNINMFKQILRERNINDVLEGDENYGLDNITT